MTELKTNQIEEINGGGVLGINWENEGKTFTDGMNGNPTVSGETGRIAYKIGSWF